jgi:archaeosine-15-forming tRNA-guanine transglycosylase
MPEVLTKISAGREVVVLFYGSATPSGPVALLRFVEIMKSTIMDHEEIDVSSDEGLLVAEGLFVVRTPQIRVYKDGEVCVAYQGVDADEMQSTIRRVQ